MYKIGDKLIEPNAPDLDRILEHAYRNKIRALCMCKGEPGIPMYLSHISESDRYLIKRMPSSGQQHEEKCGSWDVPDGVSGRGEILHTGYSLEGNRVVLKLDFPLIKYGARDTEDASDKDSAEEEKDETPAVKDQGKRLTLRAFLHMLWEDAGLNRRQPGEPKPDWASVYQRLMKAAEDKTIRRRPLIDSLYLPPPASDAQEQGLSRRKRFTEIAAQSSGSKRNCLIVVAELIGKLTSSASGDYRANLGAGSGFSLGVGKKLRDAFLKSYSHERSVLDAVEGSHQIIAATVSATAEGTAEIEEMCLMIVNQNWIPFGSIYDADLYKTLDTQGRAYERPLRYNRRRSAPMPSALLTDMGENPALLSIVLPGGDRHALESATQSMEFEKWVWDLNASDVPPVLPCRTEARAGMEGMPTSH